MSLPQKLLPGGKIRSSGGCWTCRVRRKKCTENRPACDTCTALSITCNFQEEKPRWMDGGARQKDMARKIKAEVRDRANQKRERKHMELIEADTGAMSIDDDLEHTTTTNTTTAASTSAMSTASGSNTDSTTPVTSSQGMDVVTQSSDTDYASPQDGSWFNQDINSDENPIPDPNRELHLIMIYLDYVFPYLFPHYCPPFVAGGRGWILDILYRNKAVYHGAASLAAFFFATVLASNENSNNKCTQTMGQQLEGQLELGLQELQREMTLINARKSASGQDRRIVVMQGIIQMVFFEVATSNNDNWRLHLDGAIGVFLQILPNPGEWTKTLNSLQSPRWPPLQFGLKRPWNADQAALRFFTAVVLYSDVLSSVTLGTAPRLAQYHADIIPIGARYDRSLEPARSDHLFVDEVFSLSNCIVQILGNVASLDAWKRKQKQSGSLSMTELVSRGVALSDGIKQGIESMRKQELPRTTPCMPEFLDIESVRAHCSEHRPKHQLIWLFATLSYLNVVVSGWQPSSSEIRWSVSKATELLSTLSKESGAWTLAWPLCICGCLSPPEDEDVYRSLAQRLGGLQAVGSMKDATKIMERVWSMRGELGETWDVAKCLNVLGHGVLLI